MLIRLSFISGVLPNHRQSNSAAINFMKLLEASFQYRKLVRYFRTSSSAK